MEKINLNNTCRVKLTDTGKEIIRKHPGRYEYDENGYFTTELWEIMQLFGKYLFLGTLNLPFETDFEIVNPKKH